MSSLSRIAGRYVPRLDSILTDPVYLQSLATGRLPTFTLPFVDCELPLDTEQTIADDGSIQPSCKFSPFRSCILPLKLCQFPIGKLGLVQSVYLLLFKAH